MNYTNDLPCQGCDVGWGSVSGNGETKSCHDTCEMLKAYMKAHPKPIREWALAECAEHCEEWIATGNDCNTCVLRHYMDPNTCIFADCPCNMNLDLLESRQKPRFTPEEVEAAKAIKLLRPDAVTVGVSGVCAVGDGHKIAVRDARGLLVICLDWHLFPSVKYPKTVKLAEIINEQEED